jgi:hypothetical protein
MLRHCQDSIDGEQGSLPMPEQPSVIMPVYNGARYVGAAINSVLRQTFGAFELLIMDDGSTDGTPAILDRYAGRDSRIRVFPRPRQGQIACRNELLQLARNDLVACADADDVCLPDRFEHQFRAMTQDRELWVLGTAMISIKSSGTQRKRPRVLTGAEAVAQELGRRCGIGHPSCMMRRGNILRIGGYRPAYEAAEDYDLFLRASEQGKVDNLPIVGVLYRQHDDSVSSLHALRQAVSTDLARATHSLRITGKPDPTAEITAPPQLDDPLLASLIPPAQMEFHRAIQAIADPSACPDRIGIDRALKYLLHAPIGKKRVRLFQRAVIGLVIRHPIDYLTFRAVVRALTLGPGRVARLLWSLRRGELKMTPQSYPDMQVQSHEGGLTHRASGKSGH